MWPELLILRNNYFLTFVIVCLFVCFCTFLPLISAWQVPNNLEDRNMRAAPLMSDTALLRRWIKIVRESRLPSPARNQNQKGNS